MDFLNSNAFEQMAREYNKKYSNTNNNASILSNKNNFFCSEIEQIFNKIFKLFTNLKNTFKKYNQFSTFFERSEKLCITIKEFYKDVFREDLIVNYENNNKPSNHKFCAILMLETYTDIFNLNIKVLCEIDKLKNSLLYVNNKESLDNSYFIRTNTDNISFNLHKLCLLQEMLKDFSDILKEFYIRIN